MSSRSREDGFTLVEALAALGVFALAGVGLIVLQSQSLRALAQAEERALGELAAQNALVSAVGSSLAPEPGLSVDRIEFAGGVWIIERGVFETQDASTVRLEVAATREGRPAPAARLRGFSSRSSGAGGS